jgi:hypothetical protein
MQMRTAVGKDYAGEDVHVIFRKYRLCTSSLWYVHRKIVMAN